MLYTIFAGSIILGQAAMPELAPITLRLANRQAVTVTLVREEGQAIKGDRVFDYNLSGPLGPTEGKVAVTKDPTWTRNDEPNFRLDGLSEPDSAFVVNALESVLSRSFEIGKSGGKFRLSTLAPGWNDRPKTISSRSVELKPVQFKAKYTIEGKEFEKKLGTMLVPTGRLSDPEYKDAAVPKPDEGARELNEMAPGIAAISVQPWRPEFKDTEAIISRYDLKIVSKSMQRFTVSGINPDPETVVITINPGMMLAPNRASVQHVGIASQFKMVLPTASLVSSLFGSGFQERSTAVGDSLCLEIFMALPENDPMRLALPNNSGLVRMLENSLADGKLNRKDQAGVWIVNDGASYEQIVSSLTPDPTPGEYIEALFESGRIGKVDLRSPAFEKCLDSNLLASPGSAEATAYVAGLIAELKPKPYRDFLVNQRTKLRDWLASGTEAEKMHALALLGAGSLDRDNRTWVADFLVGAKSSIGNSGTLKLLEASPVLRSFQEALLGADAGLAYKAIAVLSAFPSQSSVPWLNSASDRLPLKTRQMAESSAQSIGNSGTLR
jgi:hypothetical protein